MDVVTKVAEHGPRSSSPLQPPPFHTFHPEIHGTIGNIGILKSTILPSFSLYSSLSVATFVVAKKTDRVELKDWLWPSSQVLNAWWSAVGRDMYKNNVTFSAAWGKLSWTEKLLLGSVTVWGMRLFARIARRSVVRGKDDSRYEALKKDPGFWRTALFKFFLPEAAILSIISLPFTLPFNWSGSTVSLGAECLNKIRAFGVGLFSAGFALEVMSDTQLELHREERNDLCRDGVWSLVRHPNYLGDTLVHISFAVFNLANSFNPVIFLGPLANYLFLRFVGGDKQTEASQEERYQASDPEKLTQLREWQREKNSFWPSLRDLVSPWALAVYSCGFMGAFAEEMVRTRYNLS
ncbi:hypothetical protein N7507_006925 [Penicillium longicatenatum]|nr:hypothetical protein N7507_006925 [Penicillium longicatenatum]